MMELLECRIKDKNILKLIKEGLKAKIFTNNLPNLTPEVVTPQGGLLSPLLSNIYLHELDLFMETLTEEYKGNVAAGSRRKNPEYQKLLYSAQNKLAHKLRIPRSIPNEKGYRNLKYIRYADDFLIGVVGPRTRAIEVRDKVEQFLREKLYITLSMDKTKITHITNKIEFLGYKFTRRTLFVKQHYSGKLVTRKMTIPILDVNMEKVIARFKEANFCNGNGDPTPVFR
jgi:retron-type reverse transcriptase